MKAVKPARTTKALPMHVEHIAPASAYPSFSAKHVSHNLMIILKGSSRINKQFIHLKANWWNSTPFDSKCFTSASASGLKIKSSSKNANNSLSATYRQFYALTPEA
jgi:hypothetical protein